MLPVTPNSSGTQSRAIGGPGSRATCFCADPWLAETLGKPVFRLTAFEPNGSEGALNQDMANLANGGDAFFYGKVRTSDVPACLALQRVGFGVVDAAITFSWAGPARSGPSGVLVAQARPSQHQAIAVIAETSFRWSRFHLDPQIPASAANLIKRRWVENCFNGQRGAGVYVAEIDGEVAGFLAVMEAAGGERRAAVIDLIGVAPSCQGRGIGTALVEAFVADWRERVSELRVGTQAANIQSLRFYENTGFRIAESNYVLHAHYHGGEVLR